MVKKRKPNKKYILIFIITLAGVFLDQLTKFVIRDIFSGLSCVKCLNEMLENGGTYYGFDVIANRGIEIIKNFFYIIEVKNTGGAWGIFSGNVPILAAVNFIVIIVLLLFLKSEKNLNKTSIFYYGMLFSGIIGNLIDRIFNGYVTDFLNFYILGYDYPVFNVADILIVLGMLLMLFDVIRGEIYAYKERKN